MRIVANFDPATETSTTFNAGFSNGQGRIIIYNESNYNLSISWDAFSTYCPAWTAMLYCVSSSNVNLNWIIQSTLTTSATPPISQVLVEALDNGETVQGTFPAPLVRQTNIGNAVSTSVTATNSISNTGNAPVSNWLSVTPTDAASATFTADNSGNLTIKSDNAGALTTLLQLIAGASPQLLLGASTLDTEILSNLIMENAKAIKLKDNASTLYSILSSDNLNNVNIGTMGTGGTGRVRVVDSHGNIIASFIDANSVDSSVDGAGASITTGKVYFSIGGIKAINSGTGLSGTINHGLSGTPAAILCVCDSASSSATVGAYGYTTTQFGMTIGGGLDGRWWGYR